MSESLEDSRETNLLANHFFVGLLYVGLSCRLAGGQQEPGWTGRVIKRGEERRVVNSLPIVERPYRPVHFYGNTVRGRYYRETVLPTPRDVVAGAGAFLFKRDDSWRSEVPSAQDTQSN